MNQHQRKFLLEEIEKQYRREREALNKKQPTPPSLNNYLVAAILDGSAVLKAPESLRAAMRERVRGLGANESLVGRAGTWRARENDEQDCITLPALILFDPPQGFAEAQARFEETMRQWESEMRALDASINAMRIKVQVGSDEALESLVAQADQLCSMSLTSASTLLLPHKSQEP